MEDLFFRTHRKRWRFFVVKRAAGFEFAACFFQLHAATHDLGDVGPVDQIVDEILRNQSGHKSTNVDRELAGLWLSSSLNSSLKGR